MRLIRDISSSMEVRSFSGAAALEESHEDTAAMGFDL